MAAVPSKCQSIAEQLTAAENLEASLQAEYNQLPPGQDRSRVFFQLRAARTAVGQLRIQLSQCVNPPPPLPDLLPIGFNVTKHPDGTALDVAAVIFNEGEGSASGPFKLALGAYYVSTYGQDPPLYVYQEKDLTVPSSVTIQPGDSYTSDSMNDIPILFRPGSSMPAEFIFYVLVNGDHQLAETNLNNNYLQQLVEYSPVTNFIFPDAVRIRQRSG
jgi:hypothetical protein